MNLLLALFLVLPQDYVNHLMEDNYDEAINYCDEMMSKTTGSESFKWELEKGDIYFDKISNPDKALEIYQALIDKYPPEGGFWIFAKRYGYPDLGWMHLRIAQALELSEDYLNSAKAYETVATKFRKSPLDSFALIGVERCFKKNYQDYVATIDGYNITRLELDEMVATRPRDEKAVLDDIILQRLIYASAVEHNIKEHNFFKDNYKLRRKQLLLEEVRNYDVLEKAEPTEYEMKMYYRKNKKNYKIREEIRGKEIVVESDSLARFLLDTLTKHVESFDSLARLYSTVTSRSSGGNMGVVHRTTKPKPVEDILFSAELNTVTRIVPFDNKFGIYIVIQHKPEAYRKFDAVKKQVQALVRDENIKKLEEKFLKKLKMKANIKIVEIVDDTISSGEAEDSTMVLATVNGRQILWGELVKRNESQPFMARVNLEKTKERESLLSKLIEEDLQLELAERNKYYLHDGYFAKMKDEITKQMSSGLYTKIIIEGVSVDSQAVADYYKENKAQFKMLESVRCLEIVLDSKEFAQELRTILLNNPEEFDSLAREHSIAATKRVGGDTGLIRRGMRSKTFENIVFNLKVGSLSQVFAVNDSLYTIVKKVEHQPEGYRDIEEVRPQIEGRLLREKQRKVSNEFLAEIREKANIEIFLDKPEENTEEQEGLEEKE